jgi:hypothetical protein
MMRECAGEIDVGSHECHLGLSADAELYKEGSRRYTKSAPHVIPQR